MISGTAKCQGAWKGERFGNGQITDTVDLNASGTPPTSQILRNELYEGWFVSLINRVGLVYGVVGDRGGDRSGPPPPPPPPLPHPTAVPHISRTYPNYNSNSSPSTSKAPAVVPEGEFGCVSKRRSAYDKSFTSLSSSRRLKVGSA